MSDKYSCYFDDDESIWILEGPVDPLMSVSSEFARRVNDGEISDAEIDKAVSAVFYPMTDDWLETFGDPKNQTGIMWTLAKGGMFPDGVDPYDQRVISLLDGGEA